MKSSVSPLTFSPELLDKLAGQIRVVQGQNVGTGQNTVVCMAGGSSTGKTTQVAVGLHERLQPDSQRIAQDNFQLGRDFQGVDPIYRWDALGNYGLPESRTLLTALKSGQSAQMPAYSFREARPTGMIVLQPTPIILFEGLYAGFGDLRAIADVLIYVELPLYARLLRRVFRNVFERYRAEPALSLKSYLGGGLLPAHRDLVRQQRDAADVILRVPYQFADTIARFGLSPVTPVAAPETVLFSFGIGDESAIRVVTDATGNRCFGVFYRADCYFRFPIDDETYRLMLRTDLMAY